MFKNLLSVQQSSTDPLQSDYFRSLRARLDGSIEGRDYHEAVKLLGEYIQGIEHLTLPDRQEWIRAKLLLAESCTLIKDWQLARKTLNDVLVEPYTRAELSITKREEAQLLLAVTELGSGNLLRAATLSHISRDSSDKIDRAELYAAQTNLVQGRVISWAANILLGNLANCTLDGCALDSLLKTGDVALFRGAFGFLAGPLAELGDIYGSREVRQMLFEIQAKIVLLMEEVRAVGRDFVSHEMPEAYVQMALATGQLAVSLGDTRSSDLISDRLLERLDELLFHIPEYGVQVRETLAGLVSQSGRFVEAREILASARREHEESYRFFDASRCDIRVLKVLLNEGRMVDAEELQSKLERFFLSAMGATIHRAIARGDGDLIRQKIETQEEEKAVDSLSELMDLFYEFRLTQVAHWQPQEKQDSHFRELCDQLSFVGKFLGKNSHIVKVAFANAKFSHECGEALPNESVRALARVLETEHAGTDLFLTLRAHGFLAIILEDGAFKGPAMYHFTAADRIFQQLHDDIPPGLLSYVRFSRGQYFALIGDLENAADELNAAITALTKTENLYSVVGKEVIGLYIKVARAMDDEPKIIQLEEILDQMSLG